MRQQCNQLRRLGEDMDIWERDGGGDGGLRFTVFGYVVWPYGFSVNGLRGLLVGCHHIIDIVWYFERLLIVGNVICEAGSERPAVKYTEAGSLQTRIKC